MQDHVLRPRQAFDFGDEVTIGGRDAVSSSSAFVSDRLGSLSYHKSDHPTLNAAAALGPTSTPPTAVLLRGHRACRPGDLSADLATSPRRTLIAPLSGLHTMQDRTLHLSRFSSGRPAPAPRCKGISLHLAAPCIEVQADFPASAPPVRVVCTEFWHLRCGLHAGCMFRPL